MEIPKERRKYKRIPCKTPILHNTDPPDFYYRGTVYNFSKKGLYFESNEDLLQGHEISILIKKRSKRSAKKSHKYYDVKIVWCRELQDSRYQIGYGAKLI